MKITENLLMDTRLVGRNIKNGTVTQKAFDDHLSGLPDISDRAEVLEIEMTDVGVQHAEAKDTGEHD